MSATPPDRAGLFNYADGSRFEGKAPAEIFTEIAESQFWEEAESISGAGSTLAQTQVLIRELPPLLHRLEVHRLLDLPCGDFNWMRRLDLTGISYTGGDIVPAIVARNTAAYASEQVQFACIDLIHDDLGSYDLLFCRDCLVHLSFAAIGQVLANLCRSDIRYVMTTTFPGEAANRDIATGGWRPINLQQAPFHLPLPLLLLNEGCTEGDGAFADKSLGLWEVAALRQHVPGV
ncbi:MAG: class I SAM-dependent methyltransferase [Bacteroidia bacterium]